jgi:hypothetical protein
MDINEWNSALWALRPSFSDDRTAGEVARDCVQFASTETVLHEVNLSIRLNSSAMNKSGKNPNDR